MAVTRNPTDIASTIREQTTAHGDDVRIGVLDGHSEFGAIDNSTHRSHKQENTDQQEMNPDQQMMEQQSGHPILGKAQEFDGMATEQLETMAIADQNEEAKTKLQNQKRLEAALKAQQRLAAEQAMSPRK